MAIVQKDERICRSNKVRNILENRSDLSSKIFWTLFCLAAFAVVLVGCGEKGAAVADKPKSGIDAMTDADKVFYASSFTTLGTVPYGRCWPESLFNILCAGREAGDGARLVMFNAPKRFKQNEGYSEWLRVKSVVVERATRRVVAAKGCAGPFADDAAVQAYLDSEVRPDLNSQIVVVKNESSNDDLTA